MRLPAPTSLDIAGGGGDRIGGARESGGRGAGGRAGWVLWMDVNARIRAALYGRRAARGGGMGDYANRFLIDRQGLWAYI